MRLISDRQFDFDQQPFEVDIFHRACSQDDTRACATDADCSDVGSCVTRTVLSDRPPAPRHVTALRAPTAT
jgi:hypothetical protein